VKKQVFLVVLVAMLIGLPLAQAARAASISVPVKGVVDATGSVELVISFYDRAAGGREVYSVTKTLAVEHGVYFDMVDVPDSVFQSRQKVFVEVARPSAPALALAERAQFTKPGGQAGAAPKVSFTFLGCSLCFTCGGSYPVFNGAFTNTGTSPQERSTACSSTVATRTDTRPFLCCQ
jgi:hypothetical protein